MTVHTCIYIIVLMWSEDSTLTITLDLMKMVSSVRVRTMFLCLWTSICAGKPCMYVIDFKIALFTPYTFIRLPIVLVNLS